MFCLFHDTLEIVLIMLRRQILHLLITLPGSLNNFHMYIIRCFRLMKTLLLAINYLLKSFIVTNILILVLSANYFTCSQTIRSKTCQLGYSIQSISLYFFIIYRTPKQIKFKLYLIITTSFNEGIVKLEIIKCLSIVLYFSSYFKLRGLKILALLQRWYCLLFYQYD